MTSHISLDVDRNDLIDEELLFGGMKLTPKEQAEYRLVDTLIVYWFMYISGYVHYDGHCFASLGLFLPSLICPSSLRASVVYIFIFASKPGDRFCNSLLRILLRQVQEASLRVSKTACTRR